MKRLDIRILLEVDDEDYVDSVRAMHEIVESIKLGLEKGLDFYTYVPKGGITIVSEEKVD